MEVQIVLKYAQSISKYDEAIFSFVSSQMVEVRALERCCGGDCGAGDDVLTERPV
jgi:hypothetical protein